MTEFDQLPDDAEGCFVVPDGDYWTYPKLRDWILFRTDITASDKIAYGKLRSLAMQWMHRRRATRDQLRWLLSDDPSKPLGWSTLNKMLARLRDAGLVIVHTGNANRRVRRAADGTFTSEEAFLIELTEFPPEGRDQYTGWHTVQQKWEAYPGIGWDKSENSRSHQRSKSSKGGDRCEQGKQNVSAGGTGRTPGSKSSKVGSKSSTGSSKSSSSEGSTSENPTPTEPSFRALSQTSLRSSPAREQGAPADTGRTDGGGSTKKKNRAVRGIDPAAPVAIGGERIAITDEHQVIAEQLAAELGLTGSTATDPELSAQVVDDVGMWTQQRRDLRKLLPRAVAAADGNADAVRGWLMSKGAAAERSTFVLDAFSDDHIGDVHHCPEVEHIDVRRHRQDEARQAAQERERRLNARAERETPDPDPWTPHSGSQRPSTEGGDADAPADPAQDLAAAVELPFELTRMERTQLTVAIDDFGYETIACAVKTMLIEGTADQMRQVLRTGLLRSQLQ